MYKAINKNKTVITNIHILKLTYIAFFPLNLFISISSIHFKIRYYLSRTY